MSNNDKHTNRTFQDRAEIEALKLGTQAILEAHGHSFERAGQSRKTLCRFHQEKSASMVLHEDDHVHCYGCGWHGDVFRYLIDVGAASNFPEAIKVAKGLLGDELEILSRQSRKISPPSAAASEASDGSFMTAPVVDSYLDFVQASRHNNPILKRYGEELGFSDLGAVNEILGKYLGCMGLYKGQLAFLYRAGLKVRPLVGQSESKFYTVGKINHAWRADHIKDRTETVYIVEGESDAIAAVLSNIEDDGKSVVTAIPGCKSFQAEWADDYAEKHVIICLDADQAGQAAIDGLAAMLFPVAKSVSVVRLEWKVRGPKDIRGLFLSSGPLAVVELLKSATAWQPSVINAAETPAREGASEDPEEIPQLRLPGDNWTLGQFSGELGLLLAGKGFYMRSGYAFASVPSSEGYGSELKRIEPQMFRSMVDAHVHTFRYRKTPDGPEQVRRSMDLDSAQAVLSSHQFLDALPVLDYTRPAPMPIIRKDGTLELLGPGYDPDSRTLVHDDVPYDQYMDLQTGKHVLDGIFEEFRFAEPRSKAAAIAACLTGFCPHLMSQDAFVPAILFDANSQGSGKTTLAQIAALPYGVVAVQPAPKQETEWRKRLLPMIMAGRGVTIMDNVDHHIDSAALSMYLSSYSYSDRILGTSQEYTGKPSTIILMTGNKMTYSRDLARRVIVIDLFSDELRAEERRFKKRMDLKLLRKYRKLLMSAMWALVREWDRAGRPKCSTTNASFPEWCEVVGGIVEHNGFGDPVIRGQREDAGDIDTIDLENLAKVMGVDLAYAFKDIVTMCSKHGLFERFVDDTDEFGQLSRQAKSGFGKTLKSFDKRLVKGMGHFRVTGKGHYRRYAVISPEEPSGDAPPPQS